MSTFWERVNKTPECWLWTGRPSGNNGYGRVRIAGRSIAAHRYSWELVLGPIPDGLLVLHRCDVPLCVRPDHLFLGTQSDNLRDMSRKGRGGTAKGERNGKYTQPAATPRGSSHGGSKLTEDDVRHIRSNFTGRRGEKVTFSRQYQVDLGTIRHIIERKTWRHI